MSVFSPKNGLDERWAKAVDDDWLLEKFKFYLLLQNFDWFFDWLNIAFQDFCWRKMFSKLACDIHEIGTQNLDFFTIVTWLLQPRVKFLKGKRHFVNGELLLKKEVKSDFFLQPCPKYILLQSRDTIFSLQSHTVISILLSTTKLTFFEEVGLFFSLTEHTQYYLINIFQ